MNTQLVTQGVASCGLNELIVAISRAQDPYNLSERIIQPLEILLKLDMNSDQSMCVCMWCVCVYMCECAYVCMFECACVCTCYERVCVFMEGGREWYGGMREWVWRVWRGDGVGMEGVEG